MLLSLSLYICLSVCVEMRATPRGWRVSEGYAKSSGGIHYRRGSVRQSRKPLTPPAMLYGMDASLKTRSSRCFWVWETLLGAQRVAPGTAPHPTSNLQTHSHKHQTLSIGWRFVTSAMYKEFLANSYSYYLDQSLCHLLDVRRNDTIVLHSNTILKDIYFLWFFELHIVQLVKWYYSNNSLCIKTFFGIKVGSFYFYKKVVMTRTRKSCEYVSFK